MAVDHYLGAFGVCWTFNRSGTSNPSIDLDDYLYNPQIGGDLGTGYNDMAYRANGSTYPPPGPSTVNVQLSEWDQSTSLQPLEINVSPGGIGDSSKLEVGRRRHRTDPTVVNRPVPANNSAPPSHVNSSGSLGMDDEDQFTSSLCSYKNAECSTAAPSSSVKIRRKSKGKPENVCQILSQMEKKMSSDSDLSKTSKPSIKVEDCSASEADQNILVGDDAERFRRRSAAAKYPSQMSSVRISDRGGRDSFETAYRPAPILMPNRAGRGLYCNMKLKTDTSDTDEIQPSTSKLSSVSDGLGVEAVNDSSLQFNGLVSGKYDDDYGPRSKRFRGECEKKISLDEHLKKPLRKKGLSYSPGSFPDFKAELQRAFEEINCSPKSSCSQLSNYERSLIDLEGRVAAVDEIEKRSSDKKTSECAESIYTSDAVPKINRGDRYQATVSDWVEREITEEELAEIPDRDEKVFDCNLIAHLDPQAIAAFEMLACSEAVPIPGRNKELALHLLMANKGNLTEAVADLMKVDMLNWEHTPVVYHSIYNDSVFWTPSEIALFQEAIYKSEKDFTEVAKKVRKTVKQCVEFFYLWKKAFPDDYKKLSNLVRKRRLLTQQGYHLRSASHKDKSQKDDGSESESDLSSVAIEEKEQRAVDESCAHLYTCHTNNKSAYDEQKMVTSLQPVDAVDLGSLAGSDASASAARETTPNLSSPLGSRIPGTTHRTTIKKGAQPASDGYFHCRLCDKYFEKVKSLNAHMKSHAMKARAEAEAQAQMNLQYNSPGNGNPNMRDKLVSSNVNIANVSNNPTQLGQSQLNAVARAANALSQSASFNAVNALNQAALAQAQDLFVSTSLSQDPLVQSTLLQSPLSQASLAAQSALGPSALGQVSQNAIGQAAATQAAALGQAAQSVLGQAATQGALNSAAQNALAPSALSSVLGQGLPMSSAALQLFNSLHPTISHSTV